LTESVLLAAVGGAFGLLLSIVGIKLLTSFIPPDISQVKAITLDTRVLGFTLLVSLLTGVIFGLIPALQASMFNPNETLKEGGRESSAGSRGNRIRGFLVIAEVAVSLVLLIGAGLLINSFMRLRSVDPGFKTDNLLTMKIVLPDLKYPDHARRSAFYTDLLQRVEALPGVKSAAVTTNLPLYRQGNSVGTEIEGRPAPPPGQEIIIVTRVVSPKYLTTMGIPLLRGRQFGPEETTKMPGSVIISESMARRYWPGEDPIGKRLTPGRNAGPDDWFQIIGIAKDIRQFELNAESKPQMYLPYVQADFFAPGDLVVKTDVDPIGLAATVRRAVWEIDKEQPVSNIKTMDEIAAESVARQRFSMLLLTIFAAVALVLAAVGIYGVMSYSVTQRRSEIGIRMALGAQKSDVLKLTVGKGLKLVLIGVAFGLAGAFALTRLMASLLFGVGATDPGTFITISVVLVSVALLANYIPARRATKVDPLAALRYE
jgi:predicted permease